MGQAKLKRGTVPNDRTADKSLTTKGDIAAMELNVQGWCDQVRADVLALKQDITTETDAKLTQLRADLMDETRAVRSIMDGYRVDDLRFRNAISVRGRARRFRNWLVWLLTFGLVTLG